MPSPLRTLPKPLTRSAGNAAVRAPRRCAVGMRHRTGSVVRTAPKAQPDDGKTAGQAHSGRSVRSFRSTTSALRSRPAGPGSHPSKVPVPAGNRFLVRTCGLVRSSASWLPEDRTGRSEDGPQAGRCGRPRVPGPDKAAAAPLCATAGPARMPSDPVPRTGATAPVRPEGQAGTAPPSPCPAPPGRGSAAGRPECPAHGSGTRPAPSASGLHPSPWPARRPWRPSGRTG